MKVLEADMIRLDERTDVRQVTLANCDEETCDGLTAGIADGTITVEWGLKGWGYRNATLRDLACGGVYHALIEK